MALGRLRPSNSMIIGVGLLLFGAVLVGYGLHHLIRTGTCSSTGYSANYGPVPHCPAGTGAWVGFLIGGIFLVMIGGGISGSAAGLILPGIFCSIGAGAASVALDNSASSSTTTFGLIFGGCFFLAGAIPAVFVIGGGFGRALTKARSPSSPKRSAPPTAGVPAPSAGDAALAFGGARNEPDAILGAYSASSPPARITPTAPTFASPGAAGGSAIDKLAKLAELHKSGALTDKEFQREKTKLLAEM